MPDWVTHLGTTYITTTASLKLYPGLGRYLSPRHLFLGALLPDATRFTIILVDVLDWPAIPTFTYLIPFHSLLIVSLMAGAIALLIPAIGQSSWLGFAWIFGGALGHLILDEFEGQIGCGSTFLYPFYFSKLFPGWDSEGSFAALLLVISALFVGIAMGHRSQWPSLAVRLTGWRLLGATLLLAVALIVPLFFTQRLIDRNAYYLGFVTNPAAFEGQVVELCFSEIIASQPPTLEEFDTAFVLDTDLPLQAGEWVTVRGRYVAGKIQPAVLIHHRSFSDVYISLVAMVAFLYLMTDRRMIKEIGRRFAK